MDWYLGVLQKYVVFAGRARRQEYWMFALFSTIISFALLAIDTFVLKFHGVGLQTLYALAVLLPSLGVSVRRLHDTDKSGWWILVSLVPFIGWIILLVFMVQDSEPSDNQYGPNPKLANI